MADAVQNKMKWQVESDDGEEIWEEHHGMKAVSRHTFVFSSGQVRTFMVTFNNW